jgi:hypothetical protein
MEFESESVNIDPVKVSGSAFQREGHTSIELPAVLLWRCTKSQETPNAGTFKSR